jgi:hypothetical protein
VLSLFEINWEDALKIADKMGLNYKTNSNTPGFFVRDESGHKRKLTHSEIIGESSIEDVSSPDEKITDALKEINITLTYEIQIESKYLYFNDVLDEVRSVA